MSYANRIRAIAIISKILFATQVARSQQRAAESNTIHTERALGCA